MYDVPEMCESGAEATTQYRKHDLDADKVILCKESAAVSPKTSDQRTATAHQDSFDALHPKRLCQRGCSENVLGPGLFIHAAGVHHNAGRLVRGAEHFTHCFRAGFVCKAAVRLRTSRADEANDEAASPAPNICRASLQAFPTRRNNGLAGNRAQDDIRRAQQCPSRTQTWAASRQHLALTVEEYRKPIGSGVGPEELQATQRA